MSDERCCPVPLVYCLETDLFQCMWQTDRHAIPVRGVVTLPRPRDHHAVYTFWRTTSPRNWNKWHSRLSKFRPHAQVGGRGVTPQAYCTVFWSLINLSRRLKEKNFKRLDPESLQERRVEPRITVSCYEVTEQGAL